MVKFETFNLKADNDITLKVMYDDGVARTIELIDKNGITMASAEICELSPAKRRLADTQRISGFILNPNLFIQRLWELIPKAEDKARIAI